MINAGMDLKKLPLDDIYELLTPTPKKVLKAVVASPKTPPETEAHTMLKRYIRECDSKTLKNFLRFCTGSDLLVCDMDNKTPKSIEISFNSLSGLQRRPVAHTCGRVLDIPTTYENYPEFRSEFNSVLSSEVWAMDFV